MTPSLKSDIPGMSELTGSRIALTFEPIDCAPYEVWNFIEENTKAIIEDLSLFRNEFGEPTGVAVAVLEDDISASRLQRVCEKKFKNVDVKAYLFTSAAEMAKFIRQNAALGMESSKKIVNRKNVPLVYVLNFPGNQNELRQKFSICGTISLVDAPLKSQKLFTVYFDTEESVNKACEMFHGSDGMIVVKLYQRAAESSFIVRHVQDNRADAIRSIVQEFGTISQWKRTPTGDLAFLLENWEAAKAACILLKHLVPDDINTFFIDKYYFDSL